MCRDKLSITIDTTDCPCCKGSHKAITFVPIPEIIRGYGFTHQGQCPTTGIYFVMNTRSNEGAWEGLLKAAGL